MTEEEYLTQGEYYFFIISTSLILLGLTIFFNKPIFLILLASVWFYIFTCEEINELKERVKILEEK